jgi:surfeit locus 1 family protein
MSGLNFRRFRFSPAWAPSLLVVVLVPLFVSLGFWQLQRAGEKQSLMDQRERRGIEPALTGSDSWASEQNRYRRVELTGQWDASQQILLDNQTFNQQAGYQVLTPLRLDDGAGAVLVNRGWVPVGPDRRKLPNLAMTQGTARIIGVIDHYPGVGYALNGAEIPTPGWPTVVGVLDGREISARLGYPLLPYQVLLAADQPEGYARHWQFASLHPEKSQAYAVQWFSFAVVVLILYLRHGFKPGRAD